VEVSPHTRLAGERLQPTRPSLRFRQFVDSLTRWDLKLDSPGIEEKNDLTIQRINDLTKLAEGVGFEPTELSLNGFQDRRLKPLGHPSRFEPDPLASTIKWVNIFND
jgi:hypothetical protein